MRALSTFFGAPFIPTPRKGVEQMLKLLKLKPGEIFYDLGSGDGRIIIKAAKDYKVKAIGIEINPVLAYFSKWRIKKLSLQKKVNVYWGNFFKKNLSEADAIAVYLLQSTNNRLEKKFLAELKPKVRIASRSFTFKNIPYIKSDPENFNIRLYQIPEN